MTLRSIALTAVWVESARAEPSAKKKDRSNIYASEYKLGKAFAGCLAVGKLVRTLAAQGSGVSSFKRLRAGPE